MTVLPINTRGKQLEWHRAARREHGRGGGAGATFVCRLGEPGLRNPPMLTSAPVQDDQDYMLNSTNRVSGARGDLVLW